MRDEKDEQPVVLTYEVSDLVRSMVPGYHGALDQQDCITFNLTNRRAMQTIGSTAHTRTSNINVPQSLE